MNQDGDKVNILLVDDQQSKLLSYEAILHGLGENLLKATSGREALEHLLKSEIAVVLVDVCMPDLDGFQLAAMIREHPRFQKTAMIFISAIHLSEMDRLRGYEMGAVDYVPVPVVPEVLRAKVKIFAELYRKTRELERLNAELEERVAARTAELEMSTAQLLKSEQRRSLALAAGNMGSWDWEEATGDILWDEGQCLIFGVDPKGFVPAPENIRALVHPDDWAALQEQAQRLLTRGEPFQAEFRVVRPRGEVRWCIGSAAATRDAVGKVVRLSGVTIDITERKEAEERQTLLAREVDHRARNALAVVQSIIRLTKSDCLANYTRSIEGRIKALSVAHAVLSQSRWDGADLRRLVDEELAPYRSGPEKVALAGPDVTLEPTAAQTLTLALHELATNAAKYGALSSAVGRIELTWQTRDGDLMLRWTEKGGPAIAAEPAKGFGTKIVTESIQRQLGGRVRYEWTADGLCCEISVPRDKLKDREPPKPVPKSAGNGMLQRPARRILVVEDEALVAMELADSLTELGFTVIGPFTNLAEAKQALERGEIDAAVLDVNLGGEPIYPLAAILAARNKPFVFVTGYDSDSIDMRFKNAPVLQKPIEQALLRRLFTPAGSAEENFLGHPPADQARPEIAAG
jgi:PAS domain S-box-containing protein